MYRILIHKVGMAKDNFAYYSTIEETPVIDPITSEAKVQKTTTVFETADLEVLTAEYKKLLRVYTADQIFPVDVLKVELSAEITDETN